MHPQVTKNHLNPRFPIYARAQPFGFFDNRTEAIGPYVTILWFSVEPH
ncbi:hypothetical protein SAMN06265380_1011260 [Ruegeria faecimaris]|uniref:Uncharacterized protein n=1 Tax=Ruegeria faecimaris TaxID=686389 RepID=A0A521BV54_9RHOB|nr:hypothetical protein SAMN06265380_1011260 [Ruegeria faecimaris]